MTYYKICDVDGEEQFYAESKFPLKGEEAKRVLGLGCYNVYECSGSEYKKVAGSISHKANNT